MAYNAMVFLAELFKPTPLLRLDGLPEEWRFEYEERAGIMEYCGNMPRAQSEKEALAEIYGRMENK